MNMTQGNFAQQSQSRSYFKDILSVPLLFISISAILFGVGLGLSGMTRSSKVLGFLDVFGVWDPSLMFVMLGAIAVYATAFHFVSKRLSKPLLANEFSLPNTGKVDRGLIGGSILFGVGWGLAGVCPGPAVILSTVSTSGFVFFSSMLIGVAFYHFVKRRGIL